MIEYLLVLTLTVAIVAAVGRGIGRPMADYIQTNVLEVVKCMLRVGQFPTSSFGLCQDAINAQLDVDGNYSSSGSSGNNSSNSNSSDSDSTDSNSNSSGTGSSNSTNSNENSSSNTSIRSNNRTGSINDSGSESAFESGTTTRVKITNDDSEIGNSKLKSNFRGNSVETTVIVQRIKRKEERIGGSFKIQNDDSSGYEGVDSESYTANRSQKVPQNEFNNTSTGKRLSLPKEKDDGDRSISSEEAPSFSFLSMIKWMIIAAVLFFIIVFAASQLNSIRKGWTD